MRKWNGLKIKEYVCEPSKTEDDYKYAGILAQQESVNVTFSPKMVGELIMYPAAGGWETDLSKAPDHKEVLARVNKGGYILLPGVIVKNASEYVSAFALINEVKP